MSSYQGYLDKPPVVFISYCWTSDEHITRVMELAKRLVSDGIDVKIDKWDLKPGQDKYDFMELMVKDESINKVLIISDKKYAEKANDRKGGVGAETQIITPSVFSKADQTKFVAIIFERDDEGKECLPIYLQSRIFIDLSQPDKFEEEYNHLLREVFNRPENQKPPIGTPPSHLFEEKALSTTKTISKKKRFQHMLLDGNKYAIGAFEDYLDFLYKVIESDLKIQPSENNDPPIDDLTIESINSFIPYRDEFIEMVIFIIKYRVDISYYESIKTFLTKIVNLFASENMSVVVDNFRFIAWELFLYLIALLIFHKKINEYKLFIENPYFNESQYSKGLEQFTVFRQYIRSLDEIRNNRLNLKLLSTAANELHQRNNDIIPFNLIVQADLILFIRAKKLTEHSNWFPSTLIYSRGNKLEIFTKSEYKNEFAELLQFLNCENKEELLSLLNNDQTLQSSYFFWGHFEIAELTNFEKLGTK